MFLTKETYELDLLLNCYLWLICVYRRCEQQRLYDFLQFATDKW